VPITANQVVSIEYTLKDDDGNTLDSSEGQEPLAYLHGNDNLVLGLEKALEGQDVGATIEVSVSPAEGYGEYDSRLVQNVPVRKLPKGKAKPGMRFQVDVGHGPQIYVVRSVRGDYAQLDGNHPLAGKNLHFQVKVVGLRAPTDEELEHGHVHGEGGHHH
jgi:FKBP-type peptidyl-prolyl cis-trans isomerase SlyD